MKHLSALLLLTVPLTAQVSEDAAAKKQKAKTPRQQVTAAMLDYVEGIYDVEPARIARTVARDLDKVGILRRKQDNKLGMPKMSYEALHKLAGSWNKDGKRAGKDAPKKVEVLGMLPKVAVAKLTAAWGIDYILLHDSPKGWQIKHVIWQRLPKPVETAKADRAAVIAAAKGYARSFYQRKPELVDKYVSKDLAKYGCYNGKWSAMNHAQLKELSKHAYPTTPKNAPEEVEVLDLSDQTAVVKLTGGWGIDFMNMARTDDGWQIRQVIWQSHPKPVK